MVQPNGQALVGAALTLTVLATLGLGCPAPELEGPASLVGRPAPAMSLETLTHQRFHLNRQRGKAAVLLFWNTTCKACKQQMGSLEQLARDPGFVVANVCTDPENLDAVHRMVRGLSPGQATLLDRGAKVARAFGVAAYPTTVLITPGGKIGFVQQGRRADLSRRLRRALDGVRAR